MIFETLSVGPLQCNCIILGDEKTGEAIVIDPGDEVKKIAALLEQHKLKCTQIIHTHTHFDHVGGTSDLQAKAGGKIAIHKEALFLFEKLPMQAAMFGLAAPKPAGIDRFLKDGDTVTCGDINLEVIHTPGHTKGSLCFHLPGQMLFAGDTLFMGSIGRTDLWGGSFDEIMKSLKGRIMTLPDNLTVHCGHGPVTSIGRERRSNPFLVSS